MKMPEGLARIIEEGRRSGVTYEVNWPSGDVMHEVTAVRWRPGDRNGLAEGIIKHCHGPLKLVLDGHEYTVTPRQEEGDDEAAS